MRELNLSNKNIIDEALQQMRFDEDITYIYLGFNSIQNLENVRFPDGLQKLYLNNNQIQNLDNVRFPDGLQILYLHNNQIQNLDINMCWVLPSTKIYAENELINAIRKSTQNMAAIRIQHCYCQHLIRRNRAALTIQIQYVAYSYRIHGVAYQNAMKQHIEIT